MTKRISRRMMLKGAGAAISIPFLDITSPKSFASASLGVGGDKENAKVSNRVAYLYFPNGVARGGWEPEKVNDDGKLLKLNKWMNPLESLKDHLLIPNKMFTPRGNGHGAGTATWLTGGGYDHRRIDAGGMSVDQLIASKIGEETLLPSLELAMKGEGYFTGNLPRNSISWRNSRTPLARETVPRSVFDLMFRTSEGTGVDQSVVDLVLENAKQLRREGSRDDQRKLDEYLYSIRSIEKRLKFAESRTKEATDASELTDTLTRPADGIPTSHEKYMQLMLDMIVLAFWADATRVCTFMLDHGQSNRYFNFIPNCKGTWHALSHYRDASGRTEDDDGKTSWSSVAEKRDMYHRVTMWHHEQLAYLLNQMKKISEPNGKTLLDNSMIFYGSSLGDGNAHGEHDLPTLVAGGGCGTIETGRALKNRRSTSMSKLHLALLDRMDVEVERFAGERRRLEI